MPLPSNFDDPVLGQFCFDSRMECWTGNVNWNGRGVSLRLTVEDPDALADALQTARTLCGEAATWGPRIELFAVDKLLDLKDDSWLDDGESEIGGEEFLRRMKLTEISVDVDGSFSFWHDDGGLFWGHAIQVSGNLTDGLEYADIPG